jgi:hypothetical protein
MLIFLSLDLDEWISSFCLVRTRQRFGLAATAATATTAFAFFATAVVRNHVQFVHGFHLLSYRRLSMNLSIKKRDTSQDGVPFLTLDGLFDSKGGFGFRRELEHDLSTADRDAFLVESVEGLLAFLANVHKTRIAQDGEMMGYGGLGEADFFNDLIDGKPAATALAHDSLAGVIGDGFGKQDGIESVRHANTS